MKWRYRFALIVIIISSIIRKGFSKISKSKLQILQIRITLLLRTRWKSTRFSRKILKKENLPTCNLRLLACVCFKNVTREKCAAGSIQLLKKFTFSDLTGCIPAGRQSGHSNLLLQELLQEKFILKHQFLIPKRLREV